MNTVLSLCLLAGAAVVLFVISRRQKAEQKERRRRELIKKDYPELISKLLLLMQAGLVVRSAFIRIAADYKKEKEQGGKIRPAFEEVEKACLEMGKGIGEEEAYIRFGKRCVLPEYRTLSVLLTQNVKKGGSAFSETLEREIVTAMEERKRMARTEGERASVKLLMPMGMMLVVVLALMVIPAFLSF